MKTLDLAILALATWRLASLFANEAGPGGIFRSIREFTKKNIPGLNKGLECEWCNSVWFGTLAVILYYFFRSTAVWILLPLALSTIAIVLKYGIQTLKREPVK